MSENERDTLFWLQEIERRLANMVMEGKVVEVDPVKERARVEFHNDEGAVAKTGWIKHGAMAAGKDVKIWSGLEVGEWVTFLSPGGDLNNARVVARHFKDEGDETSNHDKSNEVKIDVGATSIVVKGESVYIKNGAGAVFHMNGTNTSLISPGNISLVSPMLYHNGKNIGDTHKHRDVIPGPALTGVPD